MKLCRLLCSLSLISVAPAWASTDYPLRQVTLVVPQAPGGASDALARIMAEKLSTRWRQTVVVENRAGAGGNIGLAQVAKAPGDGYTLLMSYEGTQAINASVYRNLPFDPIADFVPVATIATVPFLCVVNNDVKAQNIGEFIALAKANPGMTFGSAGNGSVNHLLGEMLNLAAGTTLAHVPYKGAAPAMADLIGRRIDAVFTSFPSINPQIEAGKVRAIANTSQTRSPQLPNLPTIAESGYPGFDVNPWFGIFAPRGTPNVVVEKINADIANILRDPLTVKAIAQQGATPLITAPSAFGKMLDSDTKKWAVVVDKAGAKVD